MGDFGKACSGKARKSRPTIVAGHLDGSVTVVKLLLTWSVLFSNASRQLI